MHFLKKKLGRETTLSCFGVLSIDLYCVLSMSPISSGPFVIFASLSVNRPMLDLVLGFFFANELKYILFFFIALTTLSSSNLISLPNDCFINVYIINLFFEFGPFVWVVCSNVFKSLF